LFVIFCTVTDFSAGGKGRDVKFCMRVGLLSRQVFSPFGEHWLAGSHGGGGISSWEPSGRHGIGTSSSSDTCGDGRWAVGVAGGGVA